MVNQLQALDRRLPKVVLLVGGAATLAGAIIWQPAAAAGGTALLLVLALCGLPARLCLRLAGGALVVLLTGYALLGRAFARLSAGPVYIGEIVLVLVLTTALGHGSWGPLWRHSATKLLLFFALWGAARTIPFLPVYGLDALRDAAVWGYGGFALAVAALLVRRGGILPALRSYRNLIALLLPWLALMGALRWLGSAGMMTRALPEEWYLKPGDVSVHLAGVACFVGLGLHRLGKDRSGRTWLREWWIWAAWAFCVLLFGTQNRGGMLAILTATVLGVALWRGGTWFKALYVGAAAMALFAILEPDLGTTRKASPQQVVANLLSITGDSNPSFEGTRQWRLNWWRKILDYTLYGDYFWTGKGFGVNLADEDGFQTDAVKRSLRSPHNGHLTILARTGIPGLVVWVLLQGVFAGGLLREFLRARGGRETGRAAVILWVLAYWAAFQVNAAFDVYLEGPQGGIWFWTIFGVGLALLAQRRHKRHGALTTDGPEGVRFYP